MFETRIQTYWDDADPAGRVYYASFFRFVEYAETELFRGPLERIRQVTGQTSQLSTWDLRQNTWDYAWEQIQRDPFYGAGLDNAAGATFDYVTLTHNFLLRGWFQGGLFAGAAFVLITAVCLWAIARALLQGRDAASAGVLAVILGFSMTSAALQQGYFWLLLLGAWAIIDPIPRQQLVPTRRIRDSQFLDTNRRAGIGNSPLHR